MRNSILFGIVVVMVAAAVMVGISNPTATAGQKEEVQLRPSMELSVGDEVYACNCGEACPCDTLSRNPGQCTCGVDLVKAKVKKVEPGTAVLEIKGKEKTFKTVGKYACACGLQCKCNTISQNPGNCTCGVEMAKVK
jgi:hypothetical protein